MLILGIDPGYATVAMDWYSMNAENLRIFGTVRLQHSRMFQCICG